ncbi:MAG TPA: ABC transporter substrate-binding protein [Thauera sp.]|uniref:ABC transporter substrate-binding protein n=1 Tax=Thauera sp. TaxID=1905334 RepID=UPI002C0F8682|nr:ABC transporter substrate-binding protein [Thauera sp.]HRP23494.1 ABC transporter substrate-binding protein [Thauera sp.]HRP66078.1 ABC transporter substrate-binding protein [Thauera sp.]
MKLKKIAAAALLSLGASLAQADTVKMECGAGATVKSFCDYVKARFEAETPHKLQFIDLPRASDEKLSMLQQIFATKDSKVVDVMAIDVVWPGVLDRHLLDLTEHVKDLEPAFFPSVWQNNMVNGRVKGVPNFIDAGVLFYRSDLLEKYGEQPPTTWQEMARIAAKIQDAERAAGSRNLHGFVFQGKAYEGLTCDALEWVASFGGGSFVEPDGSISANNPKAVEAFKTAANWIDTISPKGVLAYQEEEARAVFQNGDAVFMRNWPYAYLLSQDDSSPVKGKVGMMPLPRGGEGGQHAAALGGWQWAVSAYTQVPEAAIALVRMLSDFESQRQNFLQMGVSPARLDVYEDAEVQAKGPHLTLLKQAFDGAVARPSTVTRTEYPKVSKAIWNAAYDTLSGRTSAEAALADLEGRLKRFKGREWK